MMTKLRQHRLLLYLLLLVLPMQLAAGQAAETRQLALDVPATGILNRSNIVQVFTLEADAELTYSIAAVNPIGVPLAIAVTDQSGAQVAQVVDSDLDGDVELEAFSPAESGLHYITVFKAAGVASISEVVFQIVVSVVDAPPPGAEGTPEEVEAPAPTPSPADLLDVDIVPQGVDGSAAGGQVVTTAGIEVALVWSTTDDFDLEVRDPVGGSLYWQTPVVDSGGTLSQNINQGCAVTTDQSPTERATWPSGGVPTGSYEVLVYFQQACAGEVPREFTINITFNGAPLAPVEGRLSPGQVFVTSFEVFANGTAALTGNSGIVNEVELPAAPAEIFAAARPIEIGSSVNGFISNRQPFQSFSFVAQPNSLISVFMEATSGSLDTYLALLDATGAIIRFNDDVAPGITDSAIQDVLLLSGGTYTIVATRYAKDIGGTEGDYVLTLTSRDFNLPEQYLNLPNGSLEVRLLWNTSHDLQLLVRDPAGDAVYDDIPRIRSGGELLADGNLNCRPLPAEGTALSYIYWPTNIPPRPGAYEIEVWHQFSCDDPAPATFTLYVLFNGREVYSVSDTPLPNERFLTSFTIGADSSFTAGPGGIIRGVTDIDYLSELENALPIQPGAPVNGSITFENRFDLYIFNGTAGDVINIAMNNTSGSLDPLLYLIGPSGTLVAENDDAVAGENINSLIANLTLPETGQYIIIATHFGGIYGGTTGTYQLTLSQLN